MDTIAGSKHANKLELRFTARDGRVVWRAAFAFDPNRQAIVLVASEKRGKSQALLYKRLIKIADARFDKFGADCLFQIISQRYERIAALITTNPVYKQWVNIRMRYIAGCGSFSLQHLSLRLRYETRSDQRFDFTASPSDAADRMTPLFQANGTYFSFLAIEKRG